MTGKQTESADPAAARIVRCLRPKVVQARYGVAARTLRKWIALGRIKAYRPSHGVTLIDVASLEAFLAGCAVEPAAALLS